MEVLPKLDKVDAKKFVESRLLNSENKKSAEYDEEGYKMVFRIPRPMGKDVDVPISKEDYVKLTSLYL